MSLCLDPTFFILNTIPVISIWLSISYLKLTYKIFLRLTFLCNRWNTPISILRQIFSVKLVAPLLGIKKKVRLVVGRFELTSSDVASVNNTNRDIITSKLTISEIYVGAVEWGPLQPLGRISYCAMLLHATILRTYGGQMRRSFYATDYTAVSFLKFIIIVYTYKNFSGA